MLPQAEVVEEGQLQDFDGHSKFFEARLHAQGVQGSFELYPTI
jgi:hypothetical protein